MKGEEEILKKLAIRNGGTQILRSRMFEDEGLGTLGIQFYQFL